MSEPCVLFNLWIRISQSCTPIWRVVLKFLDHRALTSALLIIEPIPHPMTSVATMAAAAVP